MKISIQPRFRFRPLVSKWKTYWIKQDQVNLDQQEQQQQEQEQ